MKKYKVTPYINARHYVPYTSLKEAKKAQKKKGIGYNIYKYTEDELWRKVN